MSVSAAALPSQQTLIGPTGLVFRYSGDTVWMERDSTLRRSIRHGDTLVEQRMVDDRWGREEIRIAPRDPGEVVVATGADGKPYATPHELTTTLGSVGAIRASFSLAVLSRDRNARRLLPSAHEPPLSPEVPREYVTPASRLLQHRDTVRVIRGCPGERSDTTTFLLFGGDSAQRISPPRRTFGMGVAQGLIGQMRQVLLEAEIRAYDPTVVSDAARLFDSCRH